MYGVVRTAQMSSGALVQTIAGSAVTSGGSGAGVQVSPTQRNASAAGDLTTLPKVFDLKVDGVGYATTGDHLADIAPQLDAYKAAIISGQITVPSTL